MLAHYGIFSLCLGGKDALKTASSLRRVAQRVVFHLVFLGKKLADQQGRQDDNADNNEDYQHPLAHIAQHLYKVCRLKEQLRLRRFRQRKYIQ